MAGTQQVQLSTRQTCILNAFKSTRFIIRKLFVSKDCELFQDRNWAAVVRVGVGMAFGLGLVFVETILICRYKNSDENRGLQMSKNYRQFSAENCISDC